MSSPRTHVIQSAASFGALYPVVGWNALYFSIPVVLIDLDHVLEFYMDTKSLNPRGFFVYYGILDKNISSLWLGLNIFHTLEFYARLIALGFWHSSFWYILGGCLFHHSSDQYSLIKRGLPFCRVFSFVEYFVRGHLAHKVKNLRQLMSARPLTLNPLEQRYVESWFGGTSPSRSL